MFVDEETTGEERGEETGETEEETDEETTGGPQEDGSTSEDDTIRASPETSRKRWANKKLGQTKGNLSNMDNQGRPTRCSLAFSYFVCFIIKYKFIQSF